MTASISSFSIWPVASDVLEFLGPFDEPPLTAGLVVRTDRGVGHLVNRADRHFASPLFLVITRRAVFAAGSALSFYGEPELDKPADGFGASGAIFLP